MGSTQRLTSSAQHGFTLVEMIVSLALFSVVVTISVGALLMLIASNEQLQDEQSVMTNLSFAIDSMTRELRTGTFYYCDSSANNTGNNIFNPGTNVHDGPSGLGEDTADCSTGRPSGPNGTFHGVSFQEAGDSITTNANQRILYYHERGSGRLFRRVGNQPPLPLTSTSSILITDVEFFVTGSKPLQEGSPDHLDQASVTIFIEAREAGNPAARPYQIQTTVTQRTLDL